MTKFTRSDVMIMELGERVVWHLFLENTGTVAHRERAVKKEHH